MKLFKKDPFGYLIFLKKWLIRIIGLISFNRFKGEKKLLIFGSEIIKKLPQKKVLFISNHETYFADVTAMIHVLNASLKNPINYLIDFRHLLKPKPNIYFVAAKETMNDGIIPKILEYTGSVSVERTWREKGEEITRSVNPNDIKNIKKALKYGWLISFPQGTTKKDSPVRKGTAHIIKDNKPIVVPIVITGFKESFNKTGLKIVNNKITKTITFKKPLKIDYNDEIEKITEQIKQSIQ